MPLSGLDRFFWAAGLCGHLVLLAVLFLRGRAQRFPWFTALVGAAILRTLVLFLFHARGTPTAYTVAYLTTDMLGALLELAVIYEIASHVFRPLGDWVADARSGIYFVILGSLLLALALSWLAAPVHSDWGAAALPKAHFFFSSLEAELVLGLVLLSSATGLPWRTYVARIAYGLGAYAIADIAIETAQTLLSGPATIEVGLALTSARKTTYLLLIFYLILGLWQEVPEAREMSDEMRRNLRTVQTRVATDLAAIRTWRKP